MTKCDPEQPESGLVRVPSWTITSLPKEATERNWASKSITVNQIQYDTAPYRSRVEGTRVQACAPVSVSKRKGVECISAIPFHTPPVSIDLFSTAPLRAKSHGFPIWRALVLGSTRDPNVGKFSAGIVPYLHWPVSQGVQVRTGGAQFEVIFIKSRTFACPRGAEEKGEPRKCQCVGLFFSLGLRNKSESRKRYSAVLSLTDDI